MYFFKDKLSEYECADTLPKAAIKQKNQTKGLKILLKNYPPVGIGLWMYRNKAAMKRQDDYPTTEKLW